MEYPFYKKDVVLWYHCAQKTNERSGRGGDEGPRGMREGEFLLVPIAKKLQKSCEQFII